MRVIHGIGIHGRVVDDQTRCSHYNGLLDIIAIRFKCCDRWFPCRECHDQAAQHEAQVWPLDEFDTTAILCGACGHQLTVSEYQSCENRCPVCNAAFNPGCAGHHHLYFEVTP